MIDCLSGKVIIEKLRFTFGEKIMILALGTNAMATSLMMKAGANQGASGENAIIYNTNKVDIIIGVIGIIVSNSMLGELSPKIAKSVSKSTAFKILIPLNRCNIHIAGLKNEPVSCYIDDAIEIINKKFLLED